MSQNNLMMI